MLNMSKYHKLIFGCSAIATAALGGLVQSASAAEQFTTQNVRADRGTVLIANGNNGSTGGGVSVVNGSTAGGVNNGSTNGGVNNGSTNGGLNNGSTNGGTGVTGSNGGGTNTAGTGGSTAGNGSTGGGTGTGSTGGAGTTAGNTGSNGSGGNTSTSGGTSGLNGSTGGGTYSTTQIAAAQRSLSRFNTAQDNYSKAASALAAAEAAQTPASATSQPVRYGREALAAADCGCPNADTVGTNTPSPALVAARQAEAAAAAELAAAKAEAKEFLESVKNTNVAGSSTFSPIW